MLYGGNSIMVTPQQILLIPVAVIFIFIGTINGVFRQMDRGLNYSMKRKIKWGPFKNLYAENRKDESLHGPVLESPNCGVYAPVTYLIITYFSITLLALIWSLILVFTECTVIDYQILLFTILGLTVIFAITTLILYSVYENKYLKHQAENIHKIANILRERDK